jgi:hypothetical protein
VYYHDGVNPSPVLIAFRNAGIGGVLPDAQLRLQEVEALLDEAAEGTLRSNRRFDPIDSHAHIGELRFKFSGTLFRLYFGEPPSAPQFLVALHFHAKETRGLTPVEIRHRQDVAIQLAIDRYDAGEADQWSILPALP